MHYTCELMFQTTQATPTAVKNTQYPFACPANDSNTILDGRFEKKKVSLSLHLKCHSPNFPHFFSF